MSDKTLRYMIAIVIVMLLVFQIGTLIAGFLGMAWGAVSAIVVTAVSFFSAHLAKKNGKYSLWFLLPTLLFTALPIALVIWKALVEDVTWLDRLISLAPFFVGFGMPVILLLIVYFSLSKRAGES